MLNEMKSRFSSGKSLKIVILTLICVISGNLNSQDINGKLSTGGKFIIRDTNNTFLTLSQSTGYLSLNRSLTLPNTISSTVGVIFSGADRFIHSYGGNVFMGINSGNFTMTGANNSGLGAFSLFSNTTGIENTALGVQSLLNNTTGFNNTAVGFGSLILNTTGYDNTTVGHYSLNHNTAGVQNAALGWQSLFFNTIGSNNTALGQNSLYANTTGNYNTALGNNTGFTNTTGSNLTIIGFNAQATSPTVSNQITLGNSSVTTLRCNVVTITSLSDMRDKKNIKDLSLGLDFLMKVKPRLFNWDKREWYDNNISDGSKMQESPTAGFIAQELDEAQSTAGVEWLNLVLKDNPEKWEATPGNLLPIVVRAIQDLKAENDELKNRNEKLSAEVDSLKSMSDKLALLEQLVNEMRAAKNTSLIGTK